MEIGTCRRARGKEPSPGSAAAKAFLPAAARKAGAYRPQKGRKFFRSGESGHFLSLNEESIGPNSLTIVQPGGAVKEFLVNSKSF
jgi:hypothetical protein